MEAAMGGAGGALAQSVRDGIGDLAASLTAEAGRTTGEIDALVVTGNTAMLYLLLGHPVDGIALAPFQMDHAFGEIIAAGALFDGISADCPLYLPPCLSAYVGADITCGVLAAELLSASGPALLADIGTNGEMVLAYGGRLLCCATAAGPALEGVGIQMGSPAVPGAIDRVWRQGGGTAVHVLGEGEARSICGSGLLDAVACLLDTGDIDETGAMARDAYLGGTAVRLTQEDIRNVQLAKAAIRAGMDTLLHRAGATDPFLYLAGGFGTRLNPESAQRMGLLPSAPPARRKALGNAAGQGALQLLLDRGKTETCQEIVRRVETVELATDPVFLDAFVDRMGFED